MDITNLAVGLSLVAFTSLALADTPRHAALLPPSDFPGDFLEEWSVGVPLTLTSSSSYLFLPAPTFSLLPFYVSNFPQMAPQPDLAPSCVSQEQLPSVPERGYPPPLRDPQVRSESPAKAGGQWLGAHCLGHRIFLLPSRRKMIALNPDRAHQEMGLGRGGHQQRLE